MDTDEPRIEDRLGDASKHVPICAIYFCDNPPPDVPRGKR